MNKAKRLRDLEELDHRLRDIDFECGDWFRRQSARIREAREAVGKMKDGVRSEVNGEPAED